MIIQETSLEIIHKISSQIPEFNTPYPLSEYKKRIDNTPHLALVAIINEEYAGFKIGYEIDKTVFYSWMGGVKSSFRRMGVAKALANHQEAWLKENDYKILKMKTRNQHKNMLLFALSNGFQITGVESRESIEANRIFLEKNLW